MAVRISRILHAGYIFEHESVRLVFDPIFENPFSKNCYAFPEVAFDLPKIQAEKFSAVFISHYHDDHLSLESLSLLHKDTPIFLYCIHEALFGLIRELGFKNVTALELGNCVCIGGFQVTPHLALDADVDSVFHIEVEGLNILHVVDAWIDPSTLQRLNKVKKWDLVLWPFQTMRELEVLAPTLASPAERTIPPEWLEQLQSLQPRIVVPSSCQFQFEAWSWYNQAFFPISYQNFEKQLKAELPTAQCLRLNPGKSFKIDEAGHRAAEDIDWIRPVGNQQVDFDYDANTKPTSTKEIAGRFPKLENAHEKRALEFCHGELPTRYSKLAVEETECFAQPRHWQLILWNQDGSSHVFNFFIHKDIIELFASEPEDTSWSTELPMTKLYGALEEGEALTSLYLRIKTPIAVDVLQDPLVRVLYANSIGSYQAAQLKRIRARHRIE